MKEMSVRRSSSKPIIATKLAANNIMGTLNNLIEILNVIGDLNNHINCSLTTVLVSVNIFLAKSSLLFRRLEFSEKHSKLHYSN